MKDTIEIKIGNKTYFINKKEHDDYKRFIKE